MKLIRNTYHLFPILLKSFWGWGELWSWGCCWRLRRCPGFLDYAWHWWPCATVVQTRCVAGSHRNTAASFSFPYLHGYVAVALSTLKKSFCDWGRALVNQSFWMNYASFCSWDFFFFLLLSDLSALKSTWPLWLNLKNVVGCRLTIWTTCFSRCPLSKELRKYGRRAAPGRV